MLRAMKQPLVFLVEDDPEIRSLVGSYLKREGYRVETANTGRDLDRHILQLGEPDVLLLDIMLPEEDGLSICRRMRAKSNLPIIILTAKGDDVDRIIGLEIGADDYLPKPFNPRELLARLKAVHRRSLPPVLKQNIIAVAGLRINLDARHVVGSGGVEIDLTSAEFDLLACFAARPQRVLSRDQLIGWTRGQRFDPLDRSIDVQMSRLRRKLAYAGLPDAIQTIRNAGYMLVLPLEKS
jgi:two-component system, OmpR family, response regulator